VNKLEEDRKITQTCSGQEKTIKRRKYLEWEQAGVTRGDESSTKAREEWHDKRKGRWDEEGAWVLKCFPPAETSRPWRSQHDWAVTYTQIHTQSDTSEGRMHWPLAIQFAPLTSVWTQLICFDRCVKYSESGKGCWIKSRYTAKVLWGWEGGGCQEDPELSDTSLAKISGLHVIPKGKSQSV